MSIEGTIYDILYKSEYNQAGCPVGTASPKNIIPAIKCMRKRAEPPNSTPPIIDVKIVLVFSSLIAWCKEFAKIPAKPMTVKARAYSINPCQKLRIYAFPVAICKIPQRNPDNRPPFNPQRNARMKTGIIAKEMEPPIGQILNFKNGMISKMRANAVKMATSIKNNNRFEFKCKTLP